MNITTRFSAVLGAAALATLALAGCGSSGSSDDGGSGSSSTRSTDAATTSAASNQADALLVTDPWVKAADNGMTAAFGILVNNGAEPVTVVSAASDITDAMELHETVKNDDGTMAMQPKQGGFTVDPSGEHDLAPGGDHIMVMDLTRPVKPGEQVTLTLTMADGSTKDVVFTVKNFTGAEEKYQHGDDMQMGMG